MEFIKVILYPALTEDCAGYNTTAHMPDGQTIRSSRVKKVFGRFATAAARHELADDTGISRICFRK